MDPFRRIFVNLVRAAINKDPGRESLVDLFKLTTPGIEDGDIDQEIKRLKLCKALKLRLHPDKHPGDTSITALYQDVDVFVTKCTATLDGGPPKMQKPASPASTRFPFEFDVRDSWSYLSFEHPQYPQQCAGHDLAALVAYQCINARGSIAHGKKAELTYKNGHALANPAGVEAIFLKFGGSKTLSSIDAIKDELTKHGPVVSTSFFLSSAFLRRSENARLFVQSYKDYAHPVLIVGWKLTSFGEVWPVQPLHRRGSTVVRIAFGQFDIDQNCVAPVDSFENRYWQPGPYVGVNLSETPEWRTWTGLETSFDSIQLEKLGECFDHGLIAAVENKSKFVLHDTTKKAHSRKCHLKEVKWERKTKPWRVEMTFID